MPSMKIESSNCGASRQRKVLLTRIAFPGHMIATSAISSLTQRAVKWLDETNGTPQRRLRTLVFGLTPLSLLVESEQPDTTGELVQV
mmetsp:Transcript_93850/g.218127  ORF Transcript_93850/g.218127 Transcript_93850/m.218127 type:complete len:87 (+) Transcript_93850:1176-1436(+)